MSERERPSPAKDFKDIFSYLFRDEADIRTALPVTGVMRLGWGWAFIIDDFFRLYTRYSRLDEQTGKLVPDLDRLEAALNGEDQEAREEAIYFIRWLIILEKHLPTLLGMSPRAHEVAELLIRRVTLPEVRYTVAEASQYRAPFWGEYVGVEHAPAAEMPRRPRPPTIFRPEGGEE
uniref:Uncharacterized protein n=1 Tax=Thermosphaera aggregans TaxID=54254 RepID=A0A7C2FF33_9CREN